MAITFDATTNTDGVSASGTPAAITHNGHTIAADANYLAVCVVARDDSCASVTWNSVSLTKRIETTEVGSGVYASIWDLNSPDTGNRSCVITATGNAPTYFAAILISLKGVATSSHIDDTDSGTFVNANPSFSALTSTTDACAVIDCLASNSASQGTMTAETNRVERANFLAEAQGRAVGVSTIITKSPAGSVTMQWTDFTALSCALVGIAVKPLDGTPFFTRLGAQRI